MADRAGDSLVGGLIRGAIAGAAGVWALNEVDKYLTARESLATRQATSAARPNGLDPAHLLAARATTLMGAELAHPEDNSVGLAVKYAVGIVPAAILGALRDRLGWLTAGRGFAFGVTTWAIEDEWATTKVGLAGPASKYPWQVHGRGFIGHVVYGLTVDAVLRVLKGPPR
jgi:hypothetical protein